LIEIYHAKHICEHSYCGYFASVNSLLLYILCVKPINTPNNFIAGAGGGADCIPYSSLCLFMILCLAPSKPPTKAHASIFCMHNWQHKTEFMEWWNPTLVEKYQVFYDGEGAECWSDTQRKRRSSYKEVKLHHLFSIETYPLNQKLQYHSFKENAVRLRTDATMLYSTATAYRHLQLSTHPSATVMPCWITTWHGKSADTHNTHIAMCTPFFCHRRHWFNRRKFTGISTSSCGIFSINIKQSTPIIDSERTLTKVPDAHAQKLAQNTFAALTNDGILSLFDEKMDLYLLVSIARVVKPYLCNWDRRVVAAPPLFRSVPKTRTKQIAGWMVNERHSVFQG
jgi:hypothetical protein